MNKETTGRVQDRNKGKINPRTGQEDPEEGVEVQFYSFLNLWARWGWVTPGPGM
jgi:hypothetical protein